MDSDFSGDSQTVKPVKGRGRGRGQNLALAAHSQTLPEATWDSQGPLNSQTAKPVKGRGRGRGQNLALAACPQTLPEATWDIQGPLSGFMDTQGTESLNAPRLQLLTPSVLQNDGELLPLSPGTSNVPMEVSAPGPSGATLVAVDPQGSSASSAKRPAEGQSRVEDNVAGVLAGIVQESLKREPSGVEGDPLLVFPPETRVFVAETACRRAADMAAEDEPRAQLRSKTPEVNGPQLYKVSRPNNLIKSVVSGKLSLEPWHLSSQEWSRFSADLNPRKAPESRGSRGAVGGGDGWVVEPAAGCAITPEMTAVNEGLVDCYATSYGWCCREQWVDLVQAGFSREDLDASQPTIEITEWYGARWDCGSVFNLRVDLLDEDYKASRHPVRTFSFSKQTAQWQGGHWHKVQHQFKDYGKGVRYVRFADGGKDTQFWAGHYGSKMMGACVRVI